MGKKTIDNALQRNCVRSATVSEAHLPLPLTSLVRLPLESILSGTEVRAPPPFRKYNQVGNRHYSCLRTCTWSICLLGSAVPVKRPIISILSWVDSCLLGSQHLGAVRFCRPSSNSTYELPRLMNDLGMKLTIFSCSTARSACRLRSRTKRDSWLSRRYLICGFARSHKGTNICSYIYIPAGMLQSAGIYLRS